MVKKFLHRYYLAVILVFGLLVVSSVVGATGKLTVKPDNKLTNGQKVTVSGIGFAHRSTGAIVECNNTKNQPTIKVLGNKVPVSCSNPLSKLVTTTSTGKLSSTAFNVRTGKIGPPANGTDSSHHSASADAKKYPCPPTKAQIREGYSCVIRFGDANGDDTSQKISFKS